MRRLAPIVNPVVAVLPAPTAGMQVFYGGVLYGSDGLSWVPVGQQSFSVLTGRALVDVGPILTPEYETIVTDAKVTVGSRVSGQISDVPPPGKDADEMDMDAIHVWCRVVSDGQLYIRLIALTGPIADKFNIDYTIVKG